jgi:prophage regulatory protein
MPEKLVRKPGVLAMTGIGGSSTLYDWMAQETFPRPVKLGARMMAWRESEVLEWIAARKPATEAD